jgi:O-antigen ligase
MLRPVSLLITGISFAGLNLLELFGISFSYLFLIMILLRIDKLSYDKLSLTIIIFSLYILVSYSWGSSIREVSRVILPFLSFYLIRVAVSSRKQLEIIAIFFILGFSVAILYSLYNILFGDTLQQVVYQTTIERYSGGFSGVHSMAHTMCFFSFVYSFFYFAINQKNKIYQLINFILLIISFYCAYKASVRTVFLGLICFWSFYLMVQNFKTKIVSITLIIFCSLFFITYIQNIFWQTEKMSIRDKENLDKASSGRTMIWKNNLDVFINKYSIEEKIIGIGLGNENKNLESNSGFVFSSHNDFLTLLMTLGLLGLFFYLVLIILIIRDIIVFKISKKLKIYYIGVVASVMVMNFVSNSYINRFQLAQMFWLLIGTLYTFYELDHLRNIEVKTT